MMRDSVHFTTLKLPDYNVVMTFRFNNNNNNTFKALRYGTRSQGIPQFYLHIYLTLPLPNKQSYSLAVDFS